MPTTLLGIIAGLAVMVYAIIDVSKRDASSVLGIQDMYINLSAFLIVFGGTIASTLIAHPFSHLIRGFWAFFIVFVRRENNFVSIIEHVCDASVKYQKEGMAGLEQKLQDYKGNDLLKDGLSMIVNGYKMDEIENYLETNIQRKYDREMIDYFVFKTMGKSAPAFGLVGTLVGLIYMLRIMGENPESVGPFLAVALVATLYGLVFANLIFNPMANKLQHHAELNLRINRMEIEGITYIMRKQHPMYIKDKLSSYIPPAQRKLLFKDSGEPKK